jgi:hypothetical protein
MGLAVGCQRGGTYYQCYFVLTTEAYFVGEAVVADIVVAQALVPRPHVPFGEGVLLLAVA